MWLGTFIGKILAALFGERRRFEYEGCDVRVVTRLIPSMAVGQAWGNVILLKENGGAPFGDRLMRHEKAHVEQWRSHGSLFILFYTWEYILAGIEFGWQNAYRMNHFEVAARAAENETGRV